jgi:hypothetical protein
VFGAPEAVLLDLPQLTEDQPAHRPFVAAHAVPWPGEIAVFRSPSTDGFELLTTFGTRARIGALVSDFYAGPTSRFDLGNALVFDLLTGTLESVTDLTLFGGANALAIESAPGVWEIVQAGAAELLAPGRYRLTRLLRGQRGTEGAWATRRRPARGWWCSTTASPRCRSPRPISASRGTGALAQPAALSATRPMWRKHFTPNGRRAATLLGRPCRAAVAHAARGRGSDDPLDAPVPSASRPTAGAGSRCRSVRNWKPTRSRSSTAPP